MSSKTRANPYYIVCPPYIRTSAGIKSMHLMAHHLVELGYEAHLHTPGINTSLQAPLLTQQTVLQHEREGRTPIVIYSETLWGNPLNADCIVRYAGYFLGRLGGPLSFSADQLMLWHSKDLVESEFTEDRTLTLSIPTVDTQTFHPPNDSKDRPLTCYYASKVQDFHERHAADYFKLPDGCIEISRNPNKAQSPLEIADIFRRSSTFYAFENTTLSLEATLCGCSVQLVPNPFFTQPLDVFPIGRKGMAWGFDPKERERALATLSEVPVAYERSRQQFLIDLKHFAEASQVHSCNYSQRRRIRLIQPYQYYQTSDQVLDRVYSTLTLLWRYYGIIALPRLIRTLASADTWKMAKRIFRAIETSPGALEYPNELVEAVRKHLHQKLA